MTEQPPHSAAEPDPQPLAETESPPAAKRWSMRTVAAASVLAVVLAACGGAALASLSKGGSSGPSGHGGPGAPGGFSHRMPPGQAPGGQQFPPGMPAAPGSRDDTD